MDNSENLVIRRDADGITSLTLNRPDVLNALSVSVFIELREHLESIKKSTDSIGCVILRGEGRSFSAGGDLKTVDGDDAAPSENYQSETLSLIDNLPQPVIASVHGHCYTGALELVLACDLLIASDSALFADTHGKYGMVPLWGMGQRLTRRIGPLKAKELMLTGRVVNGPEAVSIGLANECVANNQLDARVHEVATQIVTNSWHSMRSAKRLVNEAQNRHLDEGLVWERDNWLGNDPLAMQRIKKPN